MAKNDDLTALFKAFMESRTDTAEDKDELKLRIKDLDRTLKEITQFFKTQGLYSKELGVVLKQAIEVEKQEVKRKKGSGQGLPRMVSDMHLDSIIKRAIEGSLKGTIGVFDTKSQNKLLQDSIKTIKDNQNAYEKLSSSLTGLQKSVADLGGKLATLMGTSGGAKDPAGGGGGLGALAAALAGKGKNGKDPDLKSAVPKGNGFMKGISTLIGFLGNKSGSGFLGKLGGMLAEYAKGVGWDVLKLAAYATISFFRRFFGKNWFTDALKSIKIFKNTKGLITGGKSVSKGLGMMEQVLVKAGAKKSTVKMAATAAKGLGKIGGHLIGGAASLGIGAFAAKQRWDEGDKIGASLEAISGVLGAIPHPITKLVSIIMDVFLLVRDFTSHFMGDKMPTIMKNPFLIVTPLTAMGATVKDTFKMLEFWQDKAEEQGKERNKTVDSILNWLHTSKFGRWMMGYDKEEQQGGSKEVKKGESKVLNGDQRRQKYYDKLDYLKKQRDSGDVHLQGKTNKQLASLAIKLVDKEIRNETSSTGTSVGTSAVNSTSIGAGQTYSASSAGGSRLGDAFLGGDLARISIGGEFGGARGHKGIDLPYPEGTTVRAFLPGKVTYAGWCGGFGKTIGILDKYGMVNIYGHLSNIGVKVGQEINRGEEIGKSGHTGYGVTGSKGKPLKPHLHFEVRPSMNLEASKKRGGSKDPVAYVASALGYSVDSLPDSGPMFADSSTSPGSARAASEPKGIYNEGEGDVVASAGESGESIEETLKNAYANNQFDQTGNVQFLSAINSIRVQLGKYQQIGYVN